MFGLIISIIVIGLIAGFIARAVIPGKQEMSILMTIVLGIVGSFVGGFLGYLIFGTDNADGFFQPSGIIGSIIGAIIVLLVYGAVRGRGTTTRRRSGPAAARRARGSDRSPAPRGVGDRSLPGASGPASRRHPSEWFFVTGEKEEHSAYWYADTDDASNAAVLQALRSYRAAEMAMRRRTQQSMEMGENELLVLRFLARARTRYATPWQPCTGA